MLPVIPPDADSDTIAKHLRGKVPGIKKANGKWIGLTGSLADRFMTELEAKQAHADGAGGGMQARDQPGLDGDVDDPGLSRELVAYFLEKLGFAPIRRREGSSRFLMMYGADGAHIRKMRLAFHPAGTPEDTTDKPQAIELLGAGQYYNVFGLHPSGNPYYWDTDPCDLGPFGLTPLDLDAFKAALAAVPELFGLRVVGRTPQLVGSTSGHRTALADPSKWCPSGPQLVLELLKTYRPETLGHDEFVQHMAAIKAALGETAEDHYAEVLDWAPGVRSTEDEATRKVWDSITDTSVGWNWLVDKSGDPGGVVAAADFDTPPDEANMPIDPKEMALRAINEKWVYDTVANAFYDKVDGATLNVTGFNAENIKLAPIGSQGKKTAMAIVLNDGRIEKVRTKTYYPGKPAIFDEELTNGIKRPAFNLWRPSSIVPVFGIRPDRYIEHLKRLEIDEASQNHLLDWMAFILQNPGKKIGHAPLLWSKEHGVGKDTVFVPLMYGIGKHNWHEIKPQDLQGNHNTYLCHQFIFCPEMANFEKNVVYNTLKPLIAMSQGHLTVNPKGHPTFQVPNLQNWAFLSNYGHAIPLDESDRRFLVINSPIAPLEKAYYDSLYQYLLKEGGIEIIVGWLLQRDIGHFNPAHAPPQTQARFDMIMATRPPAVRWAMNQFKAGGAFFKRAFMTVAEIIELSCEHWSGPQAPVYDNNVVSALRLLGFVPIKARVWMDDKSVTIWTNDKRPEILNSGGQLLAQRLIADQKR